MHRNMYYELLCHYCAYRIGFDGMCGLSDSCLKCDNSNVNGTCNCCIDKPVEEKTCPYFRYLAR